MAVKAARAKVKTSTGTVNVRTVAERTSRKEQLWLKGSKTELDVYRIPIVHLYFNIENGRYADKMIHLRSGNPGVQIDPREEKWKIEIWKMLKGEYAGTETDRVAFETLRKDILAKTQLRPGVVLQDGGVLDGNRRFAVLRDLYKGQPNQGRFEYFEAVILPEDVGKEDRWRIEAGLQIGKSEKLDYSPLNRLLKMKEGAELFKDKKDPIEEIANTLVGVTKPEVEQDLAKIRLVDEYLEFIRKPRAYSGVARVLERFEEILKVLEAARKTRLEPAQMVALKTKLWTTVKFETLDNWEIRDIRLALIGRGKGRRFKNDKALGRFIKMNGHEIKEYRDALIKGDKTSEIAKLELETARKFVDEMQAVKAIDEPGRLAERAETNLEQLLDTLRSGALTDHKGWEKTVVALPQTLKSVSQLTKSCLKAVGRLRRKRRNRK